MKKTVFTIIITMILSLQLNAQSVFIGLSIRWENCKFADTAICVPYLDITYQNLTGDSLYLPACATMRPIHTENIRMDDLFDFPNIKDYSMTFHIEYPLDGLWGLYEFTDDTTNVHGHHCESVAEDYYYDFSVKACKLSNHRYKVLPAYFKESDLVADSIICDKYDVFIMLDPYGSKTKSIQLLGFMVMKGTYTFVMENYRTDGQKMLVGVKYDEDNDKWNGVHCQLPDNVHGYKLFKGKYTTDSVRIKFE